MTIKGWVSSDGMSNGMEINDKTEVRRKVRNRRHFSIRLNVFFMLTFLLFSSLIVGNGFVKGGTI
jgi:hypothetical protein